MPKYRLNTNHYLHHRSNDGIAIPKHHMKGETVSYDGPPSMGMTPLDKEAKERVVHRNAERAQEQKRNRENANRASVGWSPALEKSVMRQLTGGVKD